MYRIGPPSESWKCRATSSLTEGCDEGTALVLTLSAFKTSVFRCLAMPVWLRLELPESSSNLRKVGGKREVPIAGHWKLSKAIRVRFG